MDIALIFKFFLVSTDSYGQSQNPAIYTSPVAIGTTGIDSRQSGTDVYLYNSVLHRVFVNDADSLMYWVCDTSTTTYSGAAAFDSQIMSDPDVALVAFGGKVYAIVVYHNVGAGFYCTVFHWTGGGFTKILNTSLLTGSYPNSCAVNVDGDNYGNFVITWDDGSGNIWVATGDVTSLVTNRFNLTSNANYKWPDIALFNDGTSNVATISFVNGTNSVAVEQHTYNNLSLSISSPVSPSPFSLTGISGHYMGYQPRIAVPPPAGSASDWTVVVMNAASATDSKILGWTNNSGTLYGPENYTNPGRTFWDDMTKLNNYYPSVTYDNSYPSGSFPIWVGWIFNNNSSAANTNFDMADYAVVAPCTSNGVVYNNLHEVQTGQVAGDYSDALSIAGCHTCDELTTYWENYKLNSSWVKQFNYLEVSNPVSCSSSFRSSEVFQFNESDTEFRVEIFSLYGIPLSNALITHDKLNEYLSSISNQSGVFILVLTDANGERISRKIIFK